MWGLESALGMEPLGHLAFLGFTVDGLVLPIMASGKHGLPFARIVRKQLPSLLYAWVGMEKHRSGFLDGNDFPWR